MTTNGTILHDLDVLIVDNDLKLRDELKEILLSWGLNATECENGQAAIDLLKNAAEGGRAYHLVILDAVLPDMDGFELAKRIKSDPIIRNAAIVMTSSAELNVDTTNRLQIGIFRCITKPVLQSELFSIVQGMRDNLYANAAPVPNASSEPARPRVPLKILLADENMSDQRAIATILRRYGDKLTIVANGRDAVYAIQRTNFDVVLMDIRMPIMDGRSASRAIRKWERTVGRHTPIVALVADEKDSDREDCLDSGMTLYVRKPLQSAEILEILDGLRQPFDSDPSRVDGDSGTFREPGNSRSTTDAIDLHVARDQIAGGEDGVREIAAIVVEESKKLMADMKKALETGDAKLLQRASHTLKGSASVFDARRVVETALRIELFAKDGNLDDARIVVENLHTFVEDFVVALQHYLGNQNDQSSNR